MTGPGPFAQQLLRERLVQPDSTSCGAASLVMARAVLDEAYAELLVRGAHPVTGFTMAGAVRERFHSEALAMHRRVTGLAAATGRLQMPWPTSLGTPPWAVANQLSATGTPYGWQLAVTRRAAAYESLLSALQRETPVALFVGDLWLPRHIVLGLGLASGDSLRCYDPAGGRVREVTRSSFEDAALSFGRWTRPWFVVRPR